jgi:hypothetical protein
VYRGVRSSEHVGRQNDGTDGNQRSENLTISQRVGLEGCLAPRSGKECASSVEARRVEYAFCSPDRLLPAATSTAP